jgi:hypothetical protein
MNRIEIVGLFTAMKEMCKKKQYDSIEIMVDAVLDEAVTKKPEKTTSKPAVKTTKAKK